MNSLTHVATWQILKGVQLCCENLVRPYLCGGKIPTVCGQNELSVKRPSCRGSLSWHVLAHVGGSQRIETQKGGYHLRNR